MTETLSGNIAEMSLLQILKMLNSGKMTGCVTVTNSVTDGEIYIRDGEIIHCLAGESNGENALLNMLGWLEGQFSFENDQETSTSTIDINTHELLSKGSRQINDWKIIKNVIHSMDIIYELVPGRNSHSVKLDSIEWEIISKVNATRTVSDIVEVCGKTEFEIAKTLYRLKQKGLIQERKQTKDDPDLTINDEFFDDFEKELLAAIGPVAPVIIDETIEYLGERRSAFPRKKLAALVEKTSNEIKDPDKRLLFSQKMIDVLRNY